MYDAVLALLMSLVGSQLQDIDIDNRTSILIGELSEYLAQLEITGMRLARNDLSGQDIVATGLDRQEIVLASLTPSELVSSTADLAAHLLPMMQVQRPRPAGTPTLPMGDTPSRAYLITGEDHSKSWTVNSIDSHLSISIDRRYGLT